MKMLRSAGPVVFALALVGAPSLDAQNARSEVARIHQDARIVRAFDHIVATDDVTMADLVYFTEIPAPPFMEDERGEAFRQKLIETGVDSVWVDEVGNVIGLRRGTGAESGTVVIAGHLDTVFPEETDVTVRMRGDTLYAPGIGDDTRGVTALITLLRAMNEAEIETSRDIWFVGNVGEEGLGDLRGTKHLFRNGGEGIHSFISLDGLSDSRIVHMGLGSHRYRVAFQGPGGHSWGAFGLANPAHAMGIAISHFVAGADEFTRSGPRTSYNVGVVEGGTSVNSIPFETAITVDMRSVSPESLDQVDTIFQRAMRRGLEEANALRRDGPALTLDVEMVGNRPSGEVPLDAAIVQRALAATELFDLEPNPTRSSTDSNVPISLGIPAITIGSGGNGGGAHSPEEWFLNEDGPRGIQRALVILVAQAGLAPIS